MSVHPKRGKLTPELIAALPPKGIAGDGGRLFIRRLALGRLRWDFATYFPGASMRFAPIGFYPTVSITDARLIAARKRYDSELLKIDLLADRVPTAAPAPKPEITTREQCLAWLRREFPSTFDGPKPLAHSVRADLALHAEKHGVDLGLINSTVGHYVNEDVYFNACTEGAPRINLAGQPEGAVTHAEADWAVLSEKGKIYKWRP
jgi:hypothetical protein